MKTLNSRAVQAFTLIELLAVMAIMLILAGLSFRVAKYAVLKARIGRCRADLRAICQAVESMRASSGHYCGDSPGSKQGPWLGSFGAELPKLDPWGSAYGYAAFSKVTGQAATCDALTHPNNGMSSVSQETYTDTDVRNETTDTTVIKTAHFQEYLTYSLGPDGKPGERDVDDNGDGTVDNMGGFNASGSAALGEVGAGDDLVDGNSSRLVEL